MTFSSIEISPLSPMTMLFAVPEESVSPLGRFSAMAVSRTRPRPQ
jgi:hypothetical protein